jgi:hypothetical protein
MVIILDEKRTVLALYQDWVGHVPVIGDDVLFWNEEKRSFAKVVGRTLKIEDSSVAYQEKDSSRREGKIDCVELTVRLL